MAGKVSPNHWKGQDPQKMWLKVQKAEGDACWLWTGKVNHTTGYGEFMSKRRRQGTHQWSWELTYGPIPPGQCVLHKCDVRRCCRPDHLFLGTKTANAADRDSKMRQAHGMRSGSRKLNESQVRLLRRRAADLSRPKMSYAAYGRLFGVSDVAIQKILSGENWRHLNG